MRLNTSDNDFSRKQDLNQSCLTIPFIFNASKEGRSKFNTKSVLSISEFLLYWFITFIMRKICIIEVYLLNCYFGKYLIYK